MCGIAGIFAYHSDAPPVNREELLRTREAMAKRGPDGAGIWFAGDGKVGLAHRRLSIIDLSEAGAQPMSSTDGRFQIVFNGEIYNYPKLRADLLSRGHIFRSTSDTEVLLALYEDLGPDMVHHLRGMFAFAIWDCHERSLFLARDPFGIKPLYIIDDGRSLRFASQVKALAAGGGTQREEDPAGWAAFWLLGFVPEPFTTLKGIRSLPPGHLMTATSLGAHSRAWFDLTLELRAAEAAGVSLPAAQRVELLREVLSDSVAAHRVSDVPVGLFLSAGLDSSAMLECAALENRDSLLAVTLGFEEFANTVNDEVRLARDSAERLGVKHHVRTITRRDFEQHFQSAMDAMDQPSIDGFNTYFVCLAARECGLKAALSGLGGDELLGGYPSFRQVPWLARLAGPLKGMPSIGPLFRNCAAPFIGSCLSPKFAGLLEYGHSTERAYLLRRALFMPWELSGLMGSHDSIMALNELKIVEHMGGTIEGLRRPHSKLLALETAWYMSGQLLRDADWAGMAHGVEIRVPFVDIELFRRLVQVQAGPSPLLKQDLASLVKERLSERVQRRKKTGFSTPIRAWGQELLKSSRDDRGLRGWGKVVANPRRRLPIVDEKKRRILFLASDAYGSTGGIARFNRDLIEALCSHPEVGEVVMVPRTMPHQPEPLPPQLTMAFDSSQGRVAYLMSFLRRIGKSPAYDLVICGHINLLPLARLARLFTRAPQWLVLHGIDAWNPPKGRPWTCRLASKPGLVTAVSKFTLDHFRHWSMIPSEACKVLPNTFTPGCFSPGEKPAYLMERYGLHGRPVLLTVGRMVSLERYKGFDEMIEVLPRLQALVPGLAYLAVGDGNDRERLQEKVRQLGLEQDVIFTGYIPETEKADHYRLGDAYVMPSQGEGFGIVFLEALASGLPVVGSCLDGGRDALRGGELGILVDPRVPDDICRGVLEALEQSRGRVPAGLEAFSFTAFETQVQGILDTIWSGDTCA